jgi:acetaldehyde dehydrogenase (acetylating)
MTKKITVKPGFCIQNILVDIVELEQLVGDLVAVLNAARDQIKVEVVTQVGCVVEAHYAKLVEQIARDEAKVMLDLGDS